MVPLLGLPQEVGHGPRCSMGILSNFQPPRREHPCERTVEAKYVHFSDILLFLFLKRCKKSDSLFDLCLNSELI